MHWTQQGQRVEDPALEQIDAWYKEEAEKEDIRHELRLRGLLMPMEVEGHLILSV